MHTQTNYVEETTEATDYLAPLTKTNKEVEELEENSKFVKEKSVNLSLYRNLQSISKDIKDICVDPILHSDNLYKMRNRIFSVLPQYKVLRNKQNFIIFSQKLISKRELVQLSIENMESLQDRMDTISQNLPSHIVTKAKLAINISCEVTSNLPKIDLSKTSMGLLNRFVGEADTANLLLTCYNYSLHSEVLSPIFNNIVTDFYDVVLKYCETIKTIVQESELQKEMRTWDQLNNNFFSNFENKADK